MKNKLKKNLLDKRNFVILPLRGGIGSNISQYAFGLYIQKNTKKKVIYDISWYDGIINWDCDKKYRRFFVLNKILKKKINLIKITNKKQIKEINFCRKYLYLDPKNIYSEIFNNDKKSFVIDTDDTIHYKFYYNIEKELQESIDFSNYKFNEENEKIKDLIINSEYSVAVHVRRGDFIKICKCVIKNLYFLKTIDYISNIIKKKIHFFFFSNGFDFVKKEIVPFLKSNINYTLVEINNDNDMIYDLKLMTLCNSIIMSNSTFSLSAGLLIKGLYPEKKILCPNLSIGYASMKNTINPNWLYFDYNTGEKIN